MEKSHLNVAQLLMSARAAGVSVAVLRGDKLVLEASTPPPTALVQALMRHKPAILLLLGSESTSWDAKDWQAFFAERAAICEFEAGVSRSTAEARAFQHCIAEWLNRNPAPSDPGSCAWCKRPEATGAVIVPFGTAVRGFTWLHHHCWEAWYAFRKKEAVRALSDLGIKDPLKSS